MNSFEFPRTPKNSQGIAMNYEYPKIARFPVYESTSSLMALAPFDGCAPKSPPPRATRASSELCQVRLEKQPALQRFAAALMLCRSPILLASLRKYQDFLGFLEFSRFLLGFV